MAIKIDFVSDVSQITRDLGSLGDRLDQAVDDMQQLEGAGEGAARSLEDVTDAGRDLDRVDAGDAARSLEDVSDAGEGAARSLEDVTDAGRDLERVGDAGHDAADGLGEVGDASGDAARDLTKVERALDDVADAGGETTRELRDVGDGAEKMTKEVEGEVDGMEKKVRDAFRNMADHARQSTGRVADTSRKDFDRAGDATETFRDEARSNLSETLSSFDGSLEGMVDGLQGTLGGVVADLGPAGMVGAGAIAAGIGVGMAYAENVAEGINEQGEIASALAQELSEVGGALDDIDLEGRMTEWGLAVQDNREVWEVWQDTAETGLEHVADMAQRAGTDFEDSFRGVTGSLEESQAMLEEVNSRITEMETNRGSLLDAYDLGAADQSNALHELKGEIEENIEAQERAKEIEELRADAIGVTNESLAEQVERQEELTGVLTSAEETELDYLDTLDKTNATIAENGRTLDKKTEAGRENRRALIDLRDGIFEYAAAELEAGASTEDVSRSLGEQRRAFMDAAEAAGYTETQAERLADAYGLIPEDIITDVSAKGVDSTKNELDSIDRSINTTVNVQPSGLEAAKNNIRYAFSTMNVAVNVRGNPVPVAAW